MRITTLLLALSCCCLFGTIQSLHAQNCNVHELGTFNTTNSAPVVAGEDQGQTFTACATGEVTSISFGLSAGHVGGTFNLRISSSAFTPSNLMSVAVYQTFTTGSGAQNITINLNNPYFVSCNSVYAVEIAPTGSAEWVWNFADPADYTGGTNYGFQPSSFGGFVNFTTTFDFSVAITSKMSVSASTSPVCSDGTATITTSVTNGSSPSYSWSAGTSGGNNSSVTVSNPVNGAVYTVEVTDACGMTATAQATLVVNPLPTLTVSASPICDDGSEAILTTSSNASDPTYTWSNGAVADASTNTRRRRRGASGSSSSNGTATVANPVNGTVYTVTVTDGNTGCSQTAMVTLTVNNLPVPAFNNTTLMSNLLVCSEAEGLVYELQKEALGSGGTVYGDGNGGIDYDDYQWSVTNGTLVSGNGMNPITVDWAVGATTGGIFVTVTDDNGCAAATSLEVTVRAPIEPTITGDFEICPIDPAFLDAGEYEYTPNTYAWSSGEVTQTLETYVEGIYTVTVTDNLGCTGTATVETTDICDPYITGLDDNDTVICPGDDVIATVEDYQMMAYGHAYTLTYVLFERDNLGNTTFYDSNATGTFTSPAPGKYRVCAYNELTDCQPVPSPTTSNLDDLVDVGTIADGCHTYECNDIIVPEPFVFNEDDSSTGTNNSTGNNIYTVEYCGGTPPYTLEFSSEGGFATVDQVPSPNPNCRNLQVVYGSGVSWSITVSDSHGCSDNNSTIASEEMDIPLLSIDSMNTSNETEIGENDGSATVNVSGGDDSCGTYTYEWSGPNTDVTNDEGTTTGDTISGLALGAYTVTVTDCAGTTQVAQVNVQRDGGRSGRGSGKASINSTTESILSLNTIPNPFRNQTAIVFSTSETETIRIDLYSLGGQLMDSLFQGTVESNTEGKVTLDGSKLQSGTYIVRLLTESGKIQHQKVILMR